MATPASTLGSIFKNPLDLSILGLSAGAGAAPTPGNSSTSSSSNPVLSASNQELLDQLGDQYKHLNQGSANLQPYENQQIQNINNNADLARQASQQALAARGLANSPVSGTVAANQEQNRVGQITQLQSQIPLLQDQLQLQNLGAESGFAASIPHGVTTNSNTVTQTGGGTSGFLGGLGKALGAFAGLAATASDKRLKENIHDSTDGLDKVLAMKPKEFNYKDDGEVHSGFIAQDLEKLFPSTVNTEPHSGMKMVKYHELLPKIVSAIQEMHELIGKSMKENKTAEVAA